MVRSGPILIEFGGGTSKVCRQTGCRGPRFSASVTRRTESPFSEAGQILVGGGSGVWLCREAKEAVG